jgi:hypothetical protein
VSGPTEDIADAGAKGAFAIRSDRARVVHLVPGPDGLVRSDAIDASPFTPFPERGTPEARGTIDVHDSPIGAATVGLIANVETSSPADSNLEGNFVVPSQQSSAAFYTGVSDPRISTEPLVYASTDGPLPVLMLAHADGYVTFVVVRDTQAELVTAVESFVARVTTSTTMTVEAIDPEAGTVIGACTGTNLCPQGGPNDSICPTEIVRFQTPNFTTYRATYRGALAWSQLPEITAVSSATSSSRYEIVDPQVRDFEERLVVPGDRVLLQVQNQSCDDPEAVPVEVIATGTVARVEGSALEVDFEPGVEIVRTCTGVEELPFRSARYEVYPGDETMVLARQQGLEVIEVIARSPIVSGPNGSVVEFTDRLAMRLSSPVPFSCSEGQGSIPCSTTFDCGIGRSCNDLNELVGCAQTCTPSCESPEVLSCTRALVGRICTAADIDVVPTVPFVVHATQSDGGLSSVAPQGAVFSIDRQAFLISYPGSRSIVQIATSPNGYDVERIR